MSVGNMYYLLKLTKYYKLIIVLCVIISSMATFICVFEKWFWSGLVKTPWWLFCKHFILFVQCSYNCRDCFYFSLEFLIITLLIIYQICFCLLIVVLDVQIEPNCNLFHLISLNLNKSDNRRRVGRLSRFSLRNVTFIIKHCVG